MLRIAPMLAIVLIGSQPVFNAQASRKLEPDAAQAANGRANKSCPESDQQARVRERQRSQNLLTVHGFAEHVLEFKDLTSKVRGLIGLADALWKEEEPYARKLFGTAFEAARLTAQAAGPDSGTGNNPDSSTPDFAWLRREVLARIARHDQDWARRLATKEADESKASSVYLDIAGALLEGDPKQATQYVEMSLKSGFDPNIDSFLFALRSKDPAAADALFLKEMEALAGQPHVDANQLVFFGQYVLAAEQSLMDSATWVVNVGNHALFNFSSVQPDASTEALRAYLETAETILSRPVSSTFAKEENYIAACLLLPKVRQFAPDRAAQLETAMRDLAPGLSGELTQDAIQARLNEAPSANPDTIDAARKDVNSVHDDAQRDSRCISLSYRFYQKGDFDAARAMAEEVKDLQAREKLLLLVGFEEAAKLVDRGKINDAASIAAKLAPGIERAILWLAIAHGQIEHGDTKVAIQTITWSLADSNRIQDPRRAVLILRAAAELAPFDLVLASQTLNEAVRTFNRVLPYTPLKTRWIEELSAGPRWLNFPLQVGGLDFQLGRMLAPLAKMDLEGTINQVMSLEDEDARGQSLAVLASFILEKNAIN